MDDTAPTTAFRPRYLQHGRTNPLLLTPLQSYGLFAALLLSSSAVLVALLMGTTEHREALEAIARSAESARAEAAVAVEEPPETTTYRGQRPPSPATAGEQSLQISVPEGWQWRGCRVASPDKIEILLMTR